MLIRSKNFGAWEDIVYTAIACYKLLESLLFVALAFGFLHLVHRNVAEVLQDAFESFHFDIESRFFHWLVTQASSLTDFKIRAITAFLFFHALLHGTEGVGLYLRKRWAEYLIVVSTASLLPIELYELYVRIVWWKIGILVGNALILLYFIHRLRWEDEKERARAAERRKNKKQPSRPEILPQSR